LGWFGLWPFSLMGGSFLSHLEEMDLVADRDVLGILRWCGEHARAKGGPVGGGQAYLVGEKGPELFVPNAGGQIVPNNEMGGKAVTVNFNISTVDAQGFDELLIRRRATITGIINNALTKQGKQGVLS